MTATPTSIHSARLKPKQTANKYFRAYRNSVSAFLQYRLNLGLYAIGHAISLSGLFFLWLAVYDSGGQVGTYSFAEIITYYVLISFLRMTINDAVGAGFQMIEDIKNGLITAFIIKPFNYLLSVWADILGKTTVNFIFVIPITLLILWGFDFLHILPNIQNTLIFIGFIAIALTLYYLIYALVGTCAFWADNSRNYIYATIVLSNFLNGSLIPLDLFPLWFQTASKYSPFQFLMFVPIQAFLGKIANPVLTFGGGILWVIILIILLGLLYRLGLKKYEGIGI